MQKLLAQELKQKLQLQEKIIILDVRQDYEYQMANIPNSILIPLDQLEHRLSELSEYKNDNIVVYCKAGIRSAMACQILQHNGFNSLYDLSDGIIGWLNTK